jgi:radical SAM protein with 4Fe4S-binding SPASM domain
VVSLTRLVGGRAPEGEDLRYDPRAAEARRGALPGRGPVVVWNWTRACNLACVHCYASALRHPAPDELTTREAHELLEELVALRVPALLLSGGEPLARPDALALIARARSRGLRLTLSTNGTLIDEPVADALAAARVTYVGVSLDGPPEVHDAWRGRRGAHAETLQAIRRLVRRGVRVGIRFTLHRRSLAHVPYVLDLARREGVHRVCFYHLVPAGRGARVADQGLDRAEARRVLAELLAYALEAVERGDETEILTVGNASDGVFAYLWLRAHAPARAPRALELLRRNGGNRSGVALLAIDPSGHVHPDQFSWDVDLGSVREHRLRDIWQGPATPPELEALRDRRPRLEGRCARCAWLDLCRGNLRARARAAGAPWGPDPACLLEDDEVLALPGTGT